MKSLRTEIGRFLIFAGLGAALVQGCATARLVKQLDPDSRDFLSKVRYVVTKKERADFVRLPEDRRRPFIEEFWKKRDPDLDTEENEFKEEYFRRIEEAGRLFGEGGGSEPGWLQDRGRIYILIGPPDRRETYPRGVTFYGVPTEIWYYGWFPIVFVDEAWSGNYKLEPSSAVQLVEIMSTQMRLKPWIAPEKGALDCDLKAESREGRALARLVVPYRKIWFASQGETLKTTLTAAIEIQNEAGAKLAEFRLDLPLELSEAKLEEVIRTDFVAEIPLDLKPGVSWITLTLTNGADDARVFKKIKFSF
jgi:GWxTD domain-containing protein